MKTHIKALFLLPGLVVALSLLPAGRAPAQTITTLHVFTGSDGSLPLAGLIISSNTLYGTASVGSLGNGTVFAVNTDGTGFSNLYNFTDNPPIYSITTNSDGRSPVAILLLSGKTLYGTALFGGSSDAGTVFAVNTDGTGFTNLHSFTGSSDGGSPYAGLILSGNTLYGTTTYGGSSGNGTVFAVTTNGMGFTNLYNFTATSGYPSYTNNDGARPSASLLVSGNMLYGTAQEGGSSANGTVFALHTDGTGFTNLHSFTGTDGGSPQARLALSGNTLYGTTSGTIFALNTDGTGFTNLHNFSPPQYDSVSGNYTNRDGISPTAGLVLMGNTLYGTASQGGNSGNGTVFALNTNGTGFTTLHSFTGMDGETPRGELILAGDALYGTTLYDYISGVGTVFSLSFAPQLTITPSGIPTSGIILTWPTNFAGFDYTGYTLQSTTNLASPVWTTNLSSPVVVNGQITVTNPLSGPQQFFRLMSH